MSKGLVVLVADTQQEKTLGTLLGERTQALGIRSITFDIRSHPRKDAGVFREAADFLSVYQSPQYDHALVLLDCSWDGSPGTATAIQSTIKGHLHSRGWREDACEVIAIDPELEAWVWATSPVVPDVLRTTWVDIRELARRHGYWSDEGAKPHHPKDLLEAILKQQRRPRSSAIFQELARRVGLRQCQDPAFSLLRETLVRWFPSQP